MRKNTEDCKNCFYCQKIFDEYECRFYPPGIIDKFHKLDMQRKPWCGEFLYSESKEIEPNER